MAIHYLCPRCGTKHTTPGMCPQCRQGDNRRRTELNTAHGRNTKAYRITRQLVLRRDGWRCTDCGRAQPDLTLTAHFIPRGRHTGNPDDYITLCLSCHGRLEQKEQHG